MGALTNVPSTNVWRMEVLFLQNLIVMKSPHQFVNEKLKLSWASLISGPAVQRKFAVCVQAKDFPSVNATKYVDIICEKIRTCIMFSKQKC